MLKECKIILKSTLTTTKKQAALSAGFLVMADNHNHHNVKGKLPWLLITIRTRERKKD